MPISGILHRTRIGLFQAVCRKIPTKKENKRDKCTQSDTPLSTWDDCGTDFTLGFTVAYICFMFFLLDVFHCPGIFGHTIHWFGGFAGERLEFHTPSWNGTSNDGQCIMYDHFSDSGTTTEHHAKPNVPSLLFLSGDIEMNPGPNTEVILNALAERLENKIDSFATEFKSMNNTVNCMAEKLEGVMQQLREREKDMRDTRNKMDAMEKAIAHLENELETRDILSRRDNIIFHGVTEPRQETHDDCAKTIIDLLNKTETTNKERGWAMEDIVSAHRLGKPTTKQRPIMVKLQRSRDKRLLITDRRVKEELKNKDISISDDLTIRQRQTLREERERGVIAFFRGTRLITRPATQHQRSNAETTANDRQHQREIRHADKDRHGDSPSRVRATASNQRFASREPLSLVEGSVATQLSPARDSPSNRERGGVSAGTRETSTSRGSVGEGGSRDNGMTGGNVQTRSRQNRIDQMMGARGKGNNSSATRR